MSTSLRDMCFRLLSIGQRKYSTEPGSRSNATRLMLTNALRLHIEHSSIEDAARVALEVLADPTGERGAA